MSDTLDRKIEDTQTKFYDAFDHHIRGRLPGWLEHHGYRVLGRMLRDLDPIMDRDSLAEAELTLTWVASVVRNSGGEELN
jgi:hypothetical protein